MRSRSQFKTSEMENMTAMSSENFIPLQTINFYVTIDKFCVHLLMTNFYF